MRNSFDEAKTLSQVLRIEEGEGFYIQNVLGGPLAITDRGKDGLYVDPIPAGGVLDLTYEDPRTIMRSGGLRIAFMRGYIQRLSEDEFRDQEQQMYDTADLEDEERQMKMMDVGGDVLEVEEVNLARGGRAHGGGSGRDIQQVENLLNNPRKYAEVFKKYHQELGVDPFEFRAMVESGQIAMSPSGTRGRRISMDEFADTQDQLKMTRTHATVADVQSVASKEDERDQFGDEKGVNVPRKGRMSSYAARDTKWVGEQPERTARPARRSAAKEEILVEEVDLNSEDSDWDAEERMRQNEEIRPVSDGSRPYYAGGRRGGRPINRR